MPAPNDVTHDNGLLGLASRAADNVIKLRRLDAAPKLSSGAFMAAALEATGIEAERVTAVRERFARCESPQLRTVVRQLAKVFAERTMPVWPPAPKLAKLVNIHWQQGAEYGCSQIGIAAHEVPLLALAVSIENFPHRFGGYDSLTEHKAEVAQLHSRLHDLHHRMKSVVKLSDLRTTPPTALPLPALPTPGDPDFSTQLQRRAKAEYAQQVALRKHPVGPWLRQFPTISLASETWPADLVAHILTDPTCSELRVQIEVAQAAEHDAALQPERAAKLAAVSLKTRAKIKRRVLRDAESTT